MLKKCFSIICVGFIGLFDLSAKPYQADVYYVTLDARTPITAHPVKKYISQGGDMNSGIELQLFPEFSYQTMKGIGGCFNEIGALALASLPENAQDNILRNLFASNGASFTFCRTAVGSSDFGKSAYSYAEKDGDYTMQSFSVERDEKSLIPYIQKALRFNPSLSLFASPWSPPGWMKESGQMVWGSSLKDSPDIYRSYARYLLLYLKEYAKRGIPIQRLLVQNETDCTVNYPSCVFPPIQMVKFVNGYLGPLFEEKHVDTEIWGGTYRVVKGGSYEALTVFSDSVFRKYVTGVGMQYQNYSHLMDFRQLYPDIPMMHTESECYDGENSVEQAYERLAEISKYVTAGAENFTYWNMILDETNESGWGWRQNSLLSINRNSGEVIYHPDYAVMTLISRFVRPGDKRIAHIYWEGKTFAVKGPDGTVKVFVLNKASDSKMLTIKVSGYENLQVEIPPRALSVVVCEES